MEVVIGTYEGLLLGYKIVDHMQKPVFEINFTDNSHIGCVRTVAVSENGILASGSSDESIRLFNLRRRFDIGSLSHHTDAVTALCFHGKSFLFSASMDGTIGIWRTKRWECLRALKGHKGPVYCSSVHPSGKMALSVGKDKHLCIWDLTTGKLACKRNIKQMADIVVWSPDGSKYVVVINTKAEIYAVQAAAVEDTIEAQGRINTVLFLKNDQLLLAGEGGNVYIYDISKKVKVHEFSTDTIRVKTAVHCPSPSDPAKIWMITASSDGLLKLWLLAEPMVGKWTHERLTEIDIKFRPVSAALYVPAVGTAVLTQKAEKASISDQVRNTSAEDNDKESDDQSDEEGSADGESEEEEDSDEEADSDSEESSIEDSGTEGLDEQITSTDRDSAESSESETDEPPPKRKTKEHPAQKRKATCQAQAKLDPEKNKAPGMKSNLSKSQIVFNSNKRNRQGKKKR